MGKPIPRNEIIKNLKDKIARGEPVIGCGAGTGISAKFEEAGGADLMVICHGGPFDEPENVGRALEKMPGIVGFYGASSAERLPTERAIKGQVEAFKSLNLTPK